MERRKVMKIDLDGPQVVLILPISLMIASIFPALMGVWVVVIACWITVVFTMIPVGFVLGFTKFLDYMAEIEVRENGGE